MTNEAFIEALYAPVHLNEPISVFRYIFRSLRSEVNVYPSENYYYFLCTVDGIALRGAIALFADNRDDGFLSFSYEEVGASTSAHRNPIIGAEIELSERDGVSVTKMTDVSYTVAFEGQTVVFLLRDIPGVAQTSPLRPPDELFLGASFDESGLQFDLVFNKQCNSFFWVLREGQAVPEEFEPAGAGIMVGRRTAYVFYTDNAYHRKLLIGVSAANVLENNWYDGPFDQLPDNAIKRGDLNLQQYIESAYPWTRGRIDKYGVFLSNREVRVDIAPYVEYSNLRQVRQLIDSIRRASSGNFYCALADGIRRLMPSPDR